MGRFDISEEQISVLDLEQITELLVHISEEATMLAQTEHKLYQHRRKLELIANPHIVDNVHSALVRMETPTKTLITPTKSTLSALLKKAMAQGIDISKLINASLNE